MALFTSKAKQEREVKPYDEQQLNEMLGRLRGLGATPMQFFPGQTYAEMDPRQTEALGMREEFARGMGGMVDPTMAAWRSTLSAPDVANNPYVQGMLEQQADIAGRTLREAIPGIESQAIAAGGLGGSRQGVVEALRERGIREALAQSAAQTQLGAYGQGLAQQRYGLSAAPGMAGFGMMPADVLGGVGATYRTEDQRAINEAMARHQFAQEEPWQRIQRQAALFNPLTLPYAATETTSSTTPSAFNIGTQLAGLGLAGAGMFGLGGGGVPSYGGATPMMSPYSAPRGLNPYLSDIMEYQRYRNP